MAIEHIKFDPNRANDRIPLVAENPAAIVSEVLAVFAAYTSESLELSAILGHVRSSLHEVNLSHVVKTIAFLELIGTISRVDSESSRAHGFLLDQVKTPEYQEVARRWLAAGLSEDDWRSLTHDLFPASHYSRWRLNRPIALSEGVTNFLES